MRECVYCVCALAVGFPLIFPVGRKMTSKRSLVSDAGSNAVTTAVNGKQEGKRLLLEAS